EGADPAAELHRDGGFIKDAFERLQVLGVINAERGVEVDDVQHLCAFVVPPFGDFDGIFGINRFSGSLPLRKPDTAAATQINGRDDDHADVIRLLERTAFACSLALFRNCPKELRTESILLE